MNSYTFEQLEIGQREQFQVSITEDKVKDFRSLTGDENPLHVDRDYANSKGHPETVVYGMLTASFLSTLAGMYLPGLYSLIHSVEVKFTAPVYVSMGTLTVTGEITEKDDRFHTIKIKVRITEPSGKTVCRASMKVGVIHER